MRTPRHYRLVHANIHLFGFWNLSFCSLKAFISFPEWNASKLHPVPCDSLREACFVWNWILILCLCPASKAAKLVWLFSRVLSPFTFHWHGGLNFILSTVAVHSISLTNTLTIGPHERAVKWNTPRAPWVSWNGGRANRLLRRLNQLESRDCCSLVFFYGRSFVQNCAHLFQ